MSSETPTIEEAKVVEFFNVKDPGITIMVKQDPATFVPGANPALMRDKYATFQAGHFSTSDPEIIEILKSPALRAKGVRCKDVPEDLLELGSTEEKMSWMEAEIERKAQERAEEIVAQRLHAQAQGAPIDDTPSAPPDDAEE